MIHGEGMPIYHLSGHGDLYVEYQVVLPPTLTTQQREGAPLLPASSSSSSCCAKSVGVDRALVPLLPRPQHSSRRSGIGIRTRQRSTRSCRCEAVDGEASSSNRSTFSTSSTCLASLAPPCCCCGVSSAAFLRARASLHRRPSLCPAQLLFLPGTIRCARAAARSHPLLAGRSCAWHRPRDDDDADTREGRSSPCASQPRREASSPSDPIGRASERGSPGPCTTCSSSRSPTPPFLAHLVPKTSSASRAERGQGELVHLRVALRADPLEHSKSGGGREPGRASRRPDPRFLQLPVRHARSSVRAAKG